MFDLRNKQGFKDHFARALCCAHRYSISLLSMRDITSSTDSGKMCRQEPHPGTSIGNPGEAVSRSLFPGWSPRQALLILSATPVEESYRQLWNQLHVFNRTDPYGDLSKADVEEDDKKAIAGQFLIRRVTRFGSAASITPRTSTGANGAVVECIPMTSRFRSTMQGRNSLSRWSRKRSANFSGTNGSTRHFRSECSHRSKASWKHPS